MYRPTVRYDDVYKKYVDELFRLTTLDRNQIIRGALFIAAHSEEFSKLLKPYVKKDVPLPLPFWGIKNHEIWLEQSPSNWEGGKDVNGDNKKISTIKEQPIPEGFREIERRKGEISTKKIFKQQGGITIKIG